MEKLRKILLWIGRFLCWLFGSGRQQAGKQ